MVSPRWLSASISTSGIRRSTAARPTGPATYPPAPSVATGRTLRSTRRGGADRSGVDQRRPGRPYRSAAVERLHAEGLELVAGRRNELELGPLAPDERDLGAVSAQRVRHGQRRAPRAPAVPPAPITILGALTRFDSLGRSRRAPGREMLSSSPTAASMMQRLVGA